MDRLLVVRVGFQDTEVCARFVGTHKLHLDVFALWLFVVKGVVVYLVFVEQRRRRDVYCMGHHAHTSLLAAAAGWQA